ncbi:helix-turn-helix domain-containing protein [Bradyrhizobium sp. CCBAU 53338]|uniref:winged helix-turn-helix transcriptional regulator n=1 Tax=Bradyrhizobium sp. CCBAU 53338 TaxID=1325111 RepID=UPI001FEFE036|nr:helix-turn-helix domain-containing protein [Bradyrhizobium sp. CCBAU 53338]
MEAIGDWWSLLIIRNAFNGAQRFGEFQNELGIAKNLLSARLKKLVSHGIFAIEPIEGTAFNRYILTERGEKLSMVLVALWQWGSEHCFEPSELKDCIVDNDTGEPLGNLPIRESGGRIFRAEPLPHDQHQKPIGRGQVKSAGLRLQR